MAFGGWLIDQAGRHDWIGLLAHQAEKDSRFPRSGSAHEVRAYLSRFEAGGDIFEALDDAEREYEAGH